MENKLTKMRSKLSAKKGNKGFTLVELIVVIVILAILVGVTIGGVYGYVAKSRVNTDINNASALTSGLAVVTTVKDAKPSGAVTNQDISGKTAEEVATTLGFTDSNPLTKSKIAEVLPDGVPTSKTTDVKYLVTTTVDTNTGMITSIKVVAGKVSGGTVTVLTAEE